MNISLIKFSLRKFIPITKKADNFEKVLVVGEMEIETGIKDLISIPVRMNLRVITKLLRAFQQLVVKVECKFLFKMISETNRIRKKILILLLAKNKNPVLIEIQSQNQLLVPLWIATSWDMIEMATIWFKTPMIKSKHKKTNGTLILLI